MFYRIPFGKYRGTRLGVCGNVRRGQLWRIHVRR